MTPRVGQPDTPADATLRECLAAPQRRCFVMVAGAGAGKTTSLIKALSSIVKLHGAELRRHRQRVACITYTEIAADEIWAEIGKNPLVHISTIHSFMWMIARPFQPDVGRWVATRIEEKLIQLRSAAATFGPRVQQRTKERNQRDIARYEHDLTRVASVRAFTYGTGSDYPHGVLGHDDVLRIATQFLAERRLFRLLLGQQFPFVLVDESQDTTEAVVRALKAVAAEMRGEFCLGFFGDPMQRIYMTGTGAIGLEDGWLLATKPENFRCSKAVLTVANAIRRSDDGLVQTRGRIVRTGDVERPVAGTARMFILPSDDYRDEKVLAVRDWIARQNDDPSWHHGPESQVKVLVIVHRMAANRLGFGPLYSALNDDAPEAFRNGFMDGSAWPVRPFVQLVLPLADALENGREFEAMTLLRTSCPLLRRGELPRTGVSALLADLREASLRLVTMVKADSVITNRQVLAHVREHRLMTLDPRVVSYLGDGDHRSASTGEVEDQGEATKEIRSMERFLACPTNEFWGYRRYVDEQSPFSTQQGVKGAEFDKVLVVADDEEGTHLQFSYDKYFGIRALTERDQRTLREGKETQVERTRRLFYVCCTRAMTDLAVILFTADVPAAERAVRAMDVFSSEQIFTTAALQGL